VHAARVVVRTDGGDDDDDAGQARARVRARSDGAWALSRAPETKACMVVDMGDMRGQKWKTQDTKLYWS
jgi:hypothetical protein